MLLWSLDGKFFICVLRLNTGQWQLSSWPWLSTTTIQGRWVQKREGMVASSSDLMDYLDLFLKVASGLSECISIFPLELFPRYWFTGMLIVQLLCCRKPVFKGIWLPFAWSSWMIHILSCASGWQFAWDASGRILTLQGGVVWEIVPMKNSTVFCLIQSQR